MQQILLPAIVGFFACSSNKAETSTITEEKTETSAPQASSVNAPNQTGIAGTWEMTMNAFDENKNGKLDPQERQKGVANKYRLQLNADGTCRLMNMFNGRYEVKEEKGANMLRVYRKKVEGEEEKDPLPDVYFIKSVTKDELVLLLSESFENTTFWIFKRV